MKTKLAIIILSFLALFLFAVSKNIEEEEYPNFSRAYVGERQIRLELAETGEERRRGLLGRESLSEDQGLLFLFPREDYYGIWMKDMNFSIDIIWLDDSFEIVDLKKMASPESYPEVFNPRQPALYVLEINAGILEKEGIEIGEKLEIF